MNNEQNGPDGKCPCALGSLPKASLWMTNESRMRLASGGNGKGAVPVHGRRSVTSKIPLYTEEQMLAERERCFEIGRNRD